MKYILIADDDESIVDSVRLLLEEFDYKVSTEMDGKALYKLRKPYPALILLDIWMSGVNGRDICLYLKKQKSTQNIPIIMLSANKDTAQIAKDAKADDFVTKPFDFETLQNKIEKYIKK
jgi:CheY-like chemotaxis protein